MIVNRKVMELILAFGLSAYSYGQGGVFATGYDAATQKRILGISAAAVREVNQCLPSNVPVAPLTVCNPSEECSARPGGLLYTIDVGEGALLGPRIVRAQLWRLAAAHGTFRDSDDLPQWLVAGVYYRMLEQATPAFSRNRVFPVTKLILESGRIPHLRDFVNNPLGLDDPVLYELYAESCALIIRICLAENVDCLMNLIRADIGASPADDLFAVLNRFENERDVQGWYAAEARRLAINMFQPISAETALARLRELETVPIVKPDALGGFGVVLVPLEDVAQYLKPRKQGFSKISDRLDKFDDLRADSPFLLHDAIDQYVVALRQLATGDGRDFTERIKGARTKFAKDYKTSVAVSAFLSQQAVYQGGSLLQLERRFKIRDHEIVLPHDEAIRKFLDSLR